MSAARIPEQYVCLFRLLRQSSQAYAEELERIAGSAGDEWNPRTARFEIDAYFTYLLSRALLGHKHDRQVWEDMCFLCETALIGIHGDQLSNDDLSDVFVARVEGYGQIQNRCAKSGNELATELVKALRQHLVASSHGDHVEEQHPVIIGDFLREFDASLAYLRIDHLCAGAFLCALKHILQRTNDVRTLSEQELLELAVVGQDEGIAAAPVREDVVAQSSSARRYAPLLGTVGVLISITISATVIWQVFKDPAQDNDQRSVEFSPSWHTHQWGSMSIELPGTLSAATSEMPSREQSSFAPIPMLELRETGELNMGGVQITVTRAVYRPAMTPSLDAAAADVVADQTPLSGHGGPRHDIARVLVSGLEGRRIRLQIVKQRFGRTAILRLDVLCVRRGKEMYQVQCVHDNSEQAEAYTERILKSVEF